MEEPGFGEKADHRHVTSNLTLPPFPLFSKSWTACSTVLLAVGSLRCPPPRGFSENKDSVIILQELLGFQFREQQGLVYTRAMKATEGTYHPPRRRPAYETLEKILAAAEDQLREQELESFTIQSVLLRAGLSVGAFYSRFPDKTALLHAVQERVHARVAPRILAGVDAQAQMSKSLEEAVDHGLEILVRHVLSERELFRAFMMLSVFDPLMRQKGEQFALLRRQVLTEMLAPHRGEIGHPDPDLAINTAFAIYSNVMRGRLVFYGSASDMQFGITDETLFRQLKVSLARFLGGSDPRAEHVEENL
jgi:AcrR family transcriptional regulator